MKDETSITNAMSSLTLHPSDPIQVLFNSFSKSGTSAKAEAILLEWLENFSTYRDSVVKAINFSLLKNNDSVLQALKKIGFFGFAAGVFHTISNMDRGLVKKNAVSNYFMKCLYEKFGPKLIEYAAIKPDFELLTFLVKYHPKSFKDVKDWSLDKITEAVDVESLRRSIQRNERFIDVLHNAQKYLVKFAALPSGKHLIIRLFNLDQQQNDESLNLKLEDGVGEGVKWIRRFVLQACGQGNPLITSDTIFKALNEVSKDGMRSLIAINFSHYFKDLKSYIDFAAACKNLTLLWFIFKNFPVGVGSHDNIINRELFDRRDVIFTFQGNLDGSKNPQGSVRQLCQNYSNCFINAEIITYDEQNCVVDLHHHGILFHVANRQEYDNLIIELEMNKKKYEERKMKLEDTKMKI